MWYVAAKPKKTKSGKEVIGSVVCNGVESTLKTKNIYMQFDDENGIGTISELGAKVLAGTEWELGWVDPMLEKDGTTEKVRSIKSGGKEGALGLMTTLCNLFKCYAVYDSSNYPPGPGNKLKVNLYNFNNRDQVLECVVGQNLNSLSVEQNSNDIITRMYVEGEYGDNGYIGIDSVNPTGLSYIMNFDYYRELGLISPEQEQAITAYTTNISAVKAQISSIGSATIDIEDQLNTLIGQCKVALYYTSDGFTNPKYTYGDPTPEQCALNVGDEVYVMKTYSDVSFRKTKIETTPQALIGAGDYGIAKITALKDGKVTNLEIAYEAAVKQIEECTRKIAHTTDESKIAVYEEEIERQTEKINVILHGNADQDGLYEIMDEIMKSTGLIAQLNTSLGSLDTLYAQMDDIESDFIIAMGNMLRDGYWSNQNYAPGQEQSLYDDAVDMLGEMSKPATTYTLDYVRTMEDFNIPMEDIRLNAVVRVNDDELEVYDNLFITKITIGVDHLDEGSIEVSNRDITLNSNDLGALLSRMSQLADLIDQKNALYERAKAIQKNGSIYTDRLNGMIDANKIQLLSTVSNWYTDDMGNIVFEAADGGSAMMLTGAGFMIASDKLGDGTWNWRTFGTGEGFTADEIVTGFLSAERIESGTIATSKVTPDFGGTLSIENNPSITGIDARIDILEDEISSVVRRRNKIYIQLTDPCLDEDKEVLAGDYWIIAVLDEEYNWQEAYDGTFEDLMNMHNAGTASGYQDIYCWDGEQWVHFFDTASIGEAYSRIEQTAYRIQSEVARANAFEGTIASRISQTADEITLGVIHSGAVETVGSYITIRENLIDINSDGEVNLHSGSSMTLDADAALNISAGGAVNVDAGGDININAGGSLNVTAGEIEGEQVSGEINVSAGGAINISSGGSMAISADGTFTINSDNFKIYYEDDGYGNMVQKVEIEGTIYADAGDIGGWEINPSWLWNKGSGTDGFTLVGLGSGDTTDPRYNYLSKYFMYCGADYPDEPHPGSTSGFAPFRIVRNMASFTPGTVESVYTCIGAQNHDLSGNIIGGTPGYVWVWAKGYILAQDGVTHINAHGWREVDLSALPYTGGWQWNGFLDNGIADT